MGKLLKVVGIGIGLLVVLLVVAVIVLPMIIDPNDYKDEISAAVAKQTGRELVMEGDLGLSVFPWIALDIGPTRLSNAPGFGDEPFARVEAVKISLKLLPLLRKQIEMDTVTLAGLNLNLAVNEQGVTNWDDLAAPKPEEPKPAVKPEEAAEVALAGLAIGGVDFTDARVVYDDRSTGARYAITDFSLTSGAIVPGQPVDLNLDLKLSTTQPAMDGAVSFGGSVWVSDSLQQVKLSGALLTVGLQGAELPGGALDASLRTDLSVDLAAQTLALPELVLEALGLKVSGAFNGKDIQGEKPLFSGTLKLHEFVPRTVMDKLGIEAPETADATVLGKADGQLALEASPEHLDIRDLKLRLDDSAITGGASVKNFAAPAIGFDLTLDQIDADRYLPPPAEQPVTPATPTAAAAAGASELPLETLRGLDINGTARIGSLKAFQLRSTDVLITLKARDGVIRVHPARASLYEGGYSGDLTFDVRKDTPRIAMNEKLNGIAAGPLLKDLTGDDKLQGTGNVEARLTARGIEPDQVRKTLNGNAAFSFTDGAVKGVDIAGLIEKASALLKGKPAPTDTGPKQTRFTELSGTATITNGLVKNDDLSAKTPFLRVNGRGTTHLAEESIDYLVKAKVVGSAEGQGGKSLDELKGLTIPVRVGGQYAAPTFKVQLEKVATDAAKQKVQKKVDEQKQKVEEKLQDELGDKLKGLFR